MSANLLPFTGTFGLAEARHLLRRSTFAVTAERVSEALTLDLTGTLDRLFAPDVSIGPPLNDVEPNDPNVPIGNTWVRAPLVTGLTLTTYRQNSLNAWTYENFHQAGFSLERRMWLFWLNHFGASRNGDLRSAYNYNDLLLKSALGSFPDLVKQVAREPMMLFFLDGRRNTASSPNENFARELLELFTIGKGVVAGPGDYSTYTEDDVRAMARALTGWNVRYTGSTDPALQPESYFLARTHDTTSKTLSTRFDNAVILDQGAAELDAVVDVIFARPNVGDYLCRKLYRWFVYHEITAEVESNVIQPMSAAFRAFGYQVNVPLRLLLGSEHFFEAGFRGAIVKSPLDELLDLTAGLKFGQPPTLDARYLLMRRLHNQIDLQSMRLWEPDSVAGYRPYHQEPQYNRLWLNSATLQRRTTTTRTVLTRGVAAGGKNWNNDLLAYIPDIEDASDPNVLVAEIAARMLPVELAPEQLAALKNVLIPGLPDFEWTVEYSDYLANPTDEDMRNGVNNKLIELFGAMTGTADFHLY